MLNDADAYYVQVSGLEVYLGNNISSFGGITIRDLKEKMKNIIDDLKTRLENGQLEFKNNLLDDENTLAFYNIKNGDKIRIVTDMKANRLRFLENEMKFKETHDVSISNDQKLNNERAQYVKIGGVIINLGTDPLVFSKMKINHLILKIVMNTNENLNQKLENRLLGFNYDFLQDNKTLQDYKIQNEDELLLLKFFDSSKNYEINLIEGPDTITNLENNQLKAVMSCGHTVDPNSLTAYCKVAILNGTYKFECPARNNYNEKCKKTWDYIEVRDSALLTASEMYFFETRLLEWNMSQNSSEYKLCPNCGSYGFREDKQNLRVACQVCRVLKNQFFDYCWQCGREWNVAKMTASDSCGRNNCIANASSFVAEIENTKLIIFFNYMEANFLEFRASEFKDTTIHALKQKISRNPFLSKKKWYLTYENIILQDEETFEHYGLEHDSIVMVRYT